MKEGDHFLSKQAGFNKIISARYLLLCMRTVRPLTNIKVHDGLEQIKKAAMYQKNDRKMYCIVILAVIVMLELVIVVFKYR